MIPLRRLCRRLMLVLGLRGVLRWSRMALGYVFFLLSAAFLFFRYSFHSSFFELWLTNTYPQHGSIAQLSNCTTNVIRAFFADGTVPKPKTVCPVDEPLFQKPKTPSNTRRSAELDRRLVDTWNEGQQEMEAARRMLANSLQ